MKTIVGQLPPEIVRQMHPDRIANEEAYWVARDQLLPRLEGQWIGFAGGQVVASGSSPVAVLEAAEATGLHPFLICVGKEGQPTRIRRAAFPYDSEYPGEPLPRLPVEFRVSAEVAGVILDQVIPDTGADATVVPWEDCETLGLDPSQGVQSLLSGIGGDTMPTLAFLVWVRLDGQTYACRLQADFEGTDRLLGRDVLNRIETLFRGPACEIVLNP